MICNISIWTTMNISKRQKKSPTSPTILHKNQILIPHGDRLAHFDSPTICMIIESRKQKSIISEDSDLNQHGARHFFQRFIHFLLNIHLFTSYILGASFELSHFFCTFLFPLFLFLFLVFRFAYPGFFLLVSLLLWVTILWNIHWILQDFLPYIQ